MLNYHKAMQKPCIVRVEFSFSNVNLHFVEKNTIYK